MNVLTHISLNFQQPNYLTVYAAQNDRLSRYINAQLLDGSEPWTLPTGGLMTIRFRKPDGTSGFYDTLEDGSPAYNVETDGSVTFGLAEQALTVPGSVPVELNFYNAAGSKLSTLTFIVAVKPSAYSDEDIVSSDYYNILTAKLQELAELADSAEDDYQEYLSALSGFVGAPRTAAVAADMLDTSLIYVYTGNETGWTYGDWYYYNGREWTSGGVYNSEAISLDDTLTNANKPAQAKAAGDLVLVQDTQPSAPVNKLWFPLTDPVDEQVPTYDEFLDVKSALTAALACFARVAWTTPDGEDYYNAFAAAINPPSELVSISATYTQTRPVYVTDSLEVLRQELLVTATYANTSTQTINGYALFGMLEEGTSTITVSYGGKTTTFTVTVSDTALLYKLPQPTTFDGTASTVIDSGVALVPYDRDFTIVADFTSTNGSTRQHVFYAGDIASPYNSIVLECKKTTYVWGVTSYSASIEMPNVTTDSPARIVIRHESGSDKYDIICAANGSLVRGEATTTRLISSRNMFIGGMRDTDTALGLIGTVREFKAFTRYYSDAEAMAYVSEEGV